jgi:putative sterol carrier protein
MVSKEEVTKGLEKVKSKLEEDEVKNAFKGLSERVQFVFPDINFSYILKITDGKITEGKKSVFKRPDIILSMTSDTFLFIQNKEITGRDALAQGKIQMTGVASDLMLLETYLDN